MVLEIENLSFSFIGSENPALKDINLRIGKGEFVAILGPNGSGKTTLGLCMTGIIPHFSQGIFQGRVSINNKDTSEYKIHDIARDVGILMQDYESQIFFPTIEDEIRFQLDNFGLLSDGRIAEISDELRISGLLKRNLFELSEGEKQKTLIASILSIDPDVLILDEPTSQLDSKERNNLLETLKHLNKEGKTIIMITHDTHVARHCSRFVVICGGSIVKDTSKGRFLEKNSNTGWGIEPVKHKWDVGNSCRKSAETKPVISIKHLTYETGNPVLEDVNVEIRDGEFIMILGSNGSGKTTLVKHLIKLLKVQEGAILLNGKHLKQYSQADIARMIGFIFQNPEHQIFRNTVEEEIKFTLEILKEENVAGDIKAVLKDLNLEDYRNRSPQALSTGEKQRVALASVLVSKPPVLILDEPMTHLDFNAKKHLIDYLTNLKMNGKTIIVISHHPDYYASLTDRIFLIDNKKIMEQ